MHFIRIIIRLYHRFLIHKKLNKLKKSKLDAIRLKYKLDVTQTCCGRVSDFILSPFISLYRIVIQLFYSLIATLIPIKVKRDSHMRQVNKTGTKENKLMRKVMIFLFGLMLSWIAFLFIYYQLEFSRINTILLSIGVQLVLTLMSPFFASILCVVFLMLPTLFSSKTRFIIIAYIFLEIYTNLMPNISQNLHTMVTSIACGLDIGSEGAQKASKDVMTALEKIKDEMKEPFLKMIQPFIDTKEAMKRTVEEIEERLKNMMRFMSSLHFAISGFASLPNVCGKNWDSISNECQEKLGPEVCCRPLPFFNLPRMDPGIVCDAMVSSMGLMCEKIKNALKRVGKVIQERVERIIDEMNKEFWFHIDLNHNYNYSYTKSKSYKEIINDIINGFAEKHWYFTELEFIFSYNQIFILFFTTWVLIK